MIKDLTKGSPIKAILGFAVPMLFGNLFQQMYNMADSIIVGKYVEVLSKKQIIPFLITSEH